MLPNIAKLQPMLERMTGPQLQQFAAMHHDDAVAVGLAMQIDRDRKEEMARLQGLMSGQKQPTVVDQAIQALGGQQQPPPPQQGIGAPPQGMPPQGAPQLPEQQGIGQLPAPNMEQMADGGIAGYADGGEVRMGGGGDPTEEEIRAKGRELGLSNAAIESAIQRQKAAAGSVQGGQSAYNTSANPPLIPNARTTGAAPAVAPDAPNPFVSRDQSPRGGIPFTRANIAEAAARVPELGEVIFNMQNAPYNPPPVAQTRGAPENKKPPAAPASAPTGVATLKAPSVPDIVTPRLASTPFDVGDKPTPAAIKGEVGQLVDSSDLMTKVEGAQANLRGMGTELLNYYDTNKPKKDVFSETVKRLDKEDALAVDKKGQAQGMALMMAGFKMMESPYGGRGIGALLRNAGAGAKIGAENYNSAIEKLEAAAEKRAQQRTTIEAAQDAAARGDFNARLGLLQHGQQLKAQGDALAISAAGTIFGTNATVGASLFSSAQQAYYQRQATAAGLKSAENVAQFTAENADRRAVFNAKMEMLKAQYEQAGANARAMAQITAPTPEMRMALALGGNNLEAGLRKIKEIAGNESVAKLYVESKALFDAKNMDSNKNFMSPQEFMALYNQVSSLRAPPAPTGTPTGRILR